MTRIIYSLVSLLMLTMGVVTFEHWGNRVNIFDDDSEDIREPRLFPSRQIRVPARHPSRKCDSKYERIDYGTLSHPRYLVTNSCLSRESVKNKTCTEIRYTFNVTHFLEEEMYIDNNGVTRPIKCFKKESSTAEDIAIACIPVFPTRQY